MERGDTCREGSPRKTTLAGPTLRKQHGRSGDLRYTARALSVFV